jgi:hypothetical protein
VPLQYLCLFLSAGQPGQLKKVQASVTAARKVFRIMRVSQKAIFDGWGVGAWRGVDVARGKLKGLCLRLRTANRGVVHCGSDLVCGTSNSRRGR